MNASRPELNFNIQALRAAAAYAVVGHHVVDSFRNYVAIGRVTADPKFGAMGVNVFFVISGFIMAATTDRKAITPGRFMIDRVIRIVPLYALFTMLAVVLSMAGFAVFGHDKVDLARVVHSLLFLPDLDDNGVARLPVLFPGWTLNYEMLFYVLFSVCLFIPNLGARKALACAVIAFVWLSGVIAPGPYASYLGRDVIVAFALGMAIAPAAPLPTRAAVPVALLGLIGLALPDLWPALKAAQHMELEVDCAAALIVYAFVSLEKRQASIGDGFLRRQGDASYALYLTHPFVIHIVGKIWIVSHLNRSWAGLALMVPVMVVASGIVGMATHRAIEGPITSRLRKMLPAAKPASFVLVKQS